MKTLLIVFFIAILILMLFLFPFKIRMAGHLNLIEMKVFYCFKILFFKLLCGMAEVDGFGKIQYKNSNNIFDEDIDKDFAGSFAREILSELNVKKIELFFTGGLEEDSYSSALICGSVTSIVYGLYGYLSQQYKDVKLYEDITPTFEENNLELTFDVVISVSMLQIIRSIIVAKIKTKKLKELKNER